MSLGIAEMPTVGTQREFAVGADGRDIVVIAATTAALDSLTRLIRHLPADFPAVMFLAVSLPGGTVTPWPELLTEAGSLPITYAADGEPIARSRIYVSPAGPFHLVIQPERMRLEFGPRENGVRPSADALFRSAAHVYGPRVIGVLLAGTGADGLEGLNAIQAAGGVALMQQPDRTQFVWLTPVRGAASVAVAATELPALLVRLVHESIATSDSPHSAPQDPGFSETGRGAPVDAPPARPENEASGFTCPECDGALWEVSECQ